MDNRINELRRLIRALRISMREAEAIMREQINRDENCTFVADEMIKMRTVMSGLVQERTRLGDSEPIVVGSLFALRRPPAVRPPRPVKRRLVSPVQTGPA
jgi:hypothetical protein